MKYISITFIATVGIVLAGCSTSAAPAANNLQTIPPPVPETSASLVPGPNHKYDVGGSLGVQAHANVGGSVGQTGK